MVLDIALSVGVIYGMAVILGKYCNAYLADKYHPAMTIPDMLIYAGIASVALLAILGVVAAFSALFGAIF
jgi:hypothetical protein